MKYQNLFSGKKKIWKDFQYVSAENLTQSAKRLILLLKQNHLGIFVYPSLAQEHNRDLSLFVVNISTDILNDILKECCWAMSNPASIPYKSIADRYRPVRVADGPAIDL